MLRLAVRALAMAVGLVLAVEVAFRLAGAVVAGVPEPAPDGSAVVLCVGDSHTRGRPDPENYPAELERLLNDRTGKRWRVVNAGIPGQNTAQVRSRFARYLAYYRPSIVVHLAGINNARIQSESETWERGVLGRVAEHSKVVRLVRLWRYWRRLKRDTLEAPAPELRGWQYGEGARWHVELGGRTEEVHTDPGTGEALPPDRFYAVTREDLAAMMRTAADGGVPMILVTYPMWAGDFETANRAIADAARAFDRPVADSNRALQRLMSAGMDLSQLFDDWVHPTPPLYRAMAEEVYGLLVEQGLVTAREDAG
jgi:lysophospholipase L1-like esterase